MKTFSIKPSMKYRIFKFLILTILVLFTSYIVNNYFHEFMKPLFKIKNNDIGIDLIGKGIIILLFIKMILTIFYEKIVNNYEISKTSIVVRTSILSNKINIPINGRLIIQTEQGFLQMFIGLVDIYLEADGDSSSPEGILKNVNYEIYDLLEELKSGNFNNYY